MTGVFGFLLRVGVTVWLSLLVYNVISAVFGINRMRRVYVKLLRVIYSVSTQEVLWCRFTIDVYYTPVDGIQDEIYAGTNRW